VFPVPDGDTGTNLALTFRSMAEAVDGLDDLSVAGMAARLADAGVMAARGNSGMMMSHFFLGFAEGLGDRERAGPEELAFAMRRASESLYQGLPSCFPCYASRTSSTPALRASSTSSREWCR
jgi:dihydroxyacetone kinase-like predicted kinase